MSCKCVPYNVFRLCDPVDDSGSRTATHCDDILYYWMCLTEGSQILTENIFIYWSTPNDRLVT